MAALAWMTSNPMDYLAKAKKARQRSTCAGVQVGAVLVLPCGMTVEGWNTQPWGLEPCLNRGFCVEPGQTCTSPGAPASRAIHAEIMALGTTAQLEVAVAGSVLYVTHRPCLNCIKAAIAFGVERICYEGDPYPPDFEWAGTAIELVAVAPPELHLLPIGAHR